MLRPGHRARKDDVTGKNPAELREVKAKPFPLLQEPAHFLSLFLFYFRICVYFSPVFKLLMLTGCGGS